MYWPFVVLLLGAVGFFVALLPRGGLVAWALPPGLLVWVIVTYGVTLAGDDERGIFLVFALPLLAVATAAVAAGRGLRRLF